MKKLKQNYTMEEFLKKNGYPALNKRLSNMEETNEQILARLKENLANMEELSGKTIKEMTDRERSEWLNKVYEQ